MSLAFPSSVKYIDRKARPRRVFIKRADGSLEDIFQIHLVHSNGRSAAEDALKWSLGLCECGCGQRTSISAYTDPRKGSIKGQPRRFVHGHGRTKHGLARVGSEHPLYATWESMRSRCQSLTNTRYADYGGRGIKVCKRWEHFENFLADMGERPLGKTLDRINNEGNYELENCKWSTSKEQAANKRKRRS